EFGDLTLKLFMPIRQTFQLPSEITNDAASEPSALSQAACPQDDPHQRQDERQIHEMLSFVVLIARFRYGAEEAASPSLSTATIRRLKSRKTLLQRLDYLPHDHMIWLNTGSQTGNVPKQR